VEFVQWQVFSVNENKRRSKSNYKEKRKTKLACGKHVEIFFAKLRHHPVFHSTFISQILPL
jgi:hypothetical protein